MTSPSGPPAAQTQTSGPAVPAPMLEAWGRLPAPGTEQLGSDLAAATVGAVLTRGMGRSYGDSSLPARPGDKVVATRLADRILAFDPATGVVRCEAGVCLAELNRLYMPRGWFTPVTPGTKFVTVGGMVASDVHGKNHHREGCFGAHVRWLRMRLADDSIVVCSPSESQDLYYGTIGGMGLLGHILEVEFVMHRIPSAWVWMESERVPDLDTFLAALGRTAPEWPMTMGWIDCVSRGRSMGRGILMAGRWAEAGEARQSAPKSGPLATLPFEFPNWAINPLTVSTFNTAYYWKHVRHQARGLVSPEPFFYPLDAVLHWNKVYGSRGFTQYQCVLPRAAGAPAVREFMDLLTRLGGASPLCVIKDCGPEGKGLLSFPMEGTSIAVDMAVSPEIQRIVDRLNEFVIAAGGRIYLTKDRFTRPEHFSAMEPRLPAFLAVREKYDPERRLRSAQSVRLLGDRA
ncbi:MAG: FAD-binding oxidoreductase [Pseudomonadota bacterium]|nr:FAD-binding oxidoreductase [Pseudomonadota bacterium]